MGIPIVRGRKFFLKGVATHRTSGCFETVAPQQPAYGAVLSNTHGPRRARHMLQGGAKEVMNETGKDGPASDALRADAGKGWMRRLAREGATGRRVLDLILGTTLLACFAVSAGGASAAAAPLISSGVLSADVLASSAPTLAPGSTPPAGVLPTKLGHDFASLQGALPLSLTLVSAQNGSGNPAASGDTVTFGCDVPANHACAYTVFHGDGSRQAFGLNGGQRAGVRLLPNVDRYAVVVDTAPVQTLDQCPTIQARGYFCKISFVQRGYNN